jgi:hypothetical protein
MLKRWIIVLLLATGLTACEQQEATQETTSDTVQQEQAATTRQAGNAIRLVYQEQEPGVDAYMAEVIITDDFLRIKDESEDNSFVLFDRKQQVIYSVSDENEAILVVNPERNRTIKFDKKLVEEVVEDPDAPTINGNKGQQYLYKLDGQMCLGTVVVADFMQPAQAAIQEYRLLLADQHKMSVDNVPVAMQIPCDLAINATEPLRYMTHGFPILEWNFTGFRRALVDYQLDYQPDPALFTLPEDFGRFTVRDMQEQATENQGVVK